MSGWEYDVAIVGAGIVGAACADEASRRGLRTILFDADLPGSGATNAAMGHIVVMDNSEAQFSLTRLSQQLWQRLRPELPDDVDYETLGTIWIAADEDELREAVRKHSYYESHHVPTRVLNADELMWEEPALRAELAGGLLVPEDIVVNPPSAARFLVDRATKNGATIQTCCRVEQIGDHSIRLAGGRRISAKFIVNAAGVNASDLTASIDIAKRKGHLAITSPKHRFVRHQLVELSYLKSAHSMQSDSVAFNVQPRRNGQMLVGSSRQHGSQTTTVDEDVLEQMLGRARQYLPGLTTMSISRTWTGFRAATPDHLPLIGPWPQDESVYLATGHEGLGITTSLVTGQLIADQITGIASQIPIEPYLPSRNRVKHATSDSAETGVVT